MLLPKTINTYKYNNVLKEKLKTKGDTKPYDSQDFYFTESVEKSSEYVLGKTLDLNIYAVR